MVMHREQIEPLSSLSLTNIINSKVTIGTSGVCVLKENHGLRIQPMLE